MSWPMCRACCSESVLEIVIILAVILVGMNGESRQRTTLMGVVMSLVLGFVASMQKDEFDHKIRPTAVARQSRVE